MCSSDLVRLSFDERAKNFFDTLLIFPRGIKEDWVINEFESKIVDYVIDIKVLRDKDNSEKKKIRVILPNVSEEKIYSMALSCLKLKEEAIAQGYEVIGV